MLVLALIWLAVSKKRLYPKQTNKQKEFIVIIPVLREQKILRKTIDHFLSMNYDLNKMTVLLVSTEKEIKEATQNHLVEQTTIDLITELKKEINLRFNKEIIVHLHYPLADGKMAHQINYAFDYILCNLKTDPRNLFVAIYNADSRPDINTLFFVSSLAENDKLKVFQQSALYFDNFLPIRDSKGFLTRNYLIANATLHSRWTLAHEIPRLLRQSFFINHFKKGVFLSHCVGHGLFLRGDLLQQIKTMPTTTVTEDLFFGYILSVLGISINPIPVLESAEAPATFLTALKQKYVWFFGPLDHFSYEKYFKNNFPSFTRFGVLKWFTLQGIIPAIAWFFMGWLFLFILIYPLIIQNYRLFFISILLLLCYGPLSYISVLFIGKKTNNLNYIRYQDYLWLIIFCLPAIFIHSLPPIFTLGAKIKFLFTHQEPSKPKTER